MCSLLYGEGSQNQQVVGPFSGLNNADNPAAISDNKAQDLLNVDLSLNGKSVKKRDGYGLAYSLGITTSVVHGVYDFYDLNGNDIALAFNDTRLSSIINGTAPQIIMSSGALNATYQCVDSQGFAYCANTSRTRIIKTNGLTFSSIPNLNSTGTIVALTPDRLVTSGFSDATNRIDFSASADFTNWTTGVSPTSAFQFTVSAPGSKITMLCYAFNRIMWFKDSSFGYILPGQTAADWVVKTVSPNIGTLDNSYVYYQGILYFRGNDAHIWSYDGSNLVKLTRDISQTILGSQTRSQASWSQSTEAEFEAGSLTTLDSTSTVNALLLQLNADKQKIDGYVGSVVSYSPICNTVSAERAVSQQFVPSAGGYLMTSITMRLQRVGTPTSAIVRIVNDSSNYPGTTVIVSTIISPGIVSASTYTDYVVNFNAPVPLTGGTAYWIQLVQSDSGGCFSSYPRWGLDSGLGLSGWYAGTPNFGGVSNGQHFFFRLNAKDYNATGSYKSVVRNAPGISSWDSFTATKDDYYGSHTFYVRSSTGQFSVSSSTPAWTAITPGNIPSISTAPFFQVRDDFFTSNYAYSPVLYDFTLNWFEGTANDKAYATYYKDSVWWEVTAGTSPSNNRVLKLDLLNQAWLIYDIQANGFYLRNNDLYFGSSAGGYLYKFGDSTSDNGSAINAYWKSKDFFNGSPFTDDDITDLSIFFSAVANSSMTVTYTLVGSSSTSFVVPTQRTNASFGNNNRNLPLGTVGNTFNIKFGNNAADQPFEVFAVQYGWQPKSWKPQK